MDGTSGLAVKEVERWLVGVGVGGDRTFCPSLRAREASHHA